MDLLQKLHGHRQHFSFGERQMILQNRQFILPIGKTQRQGRLQAAQNIVGDLVGGFVLVHGDDAAKVGGEPES